MIIRNYLLVSKTSGIAFEFFDSLKGADRKETGEIDQGFFFLQKLVFEIPFADEEGWW